MNLVHSKLAYSSGSQLQGFVYAFNKLGRTAEESRKLAQQRYILNSGDRIKTSVLPDSKYFTNIERYRLVHENYHSSYLDVINRTDFTDILLVDLQGNVVYSVKKNQAFGSNLLTGKNKDHVLGQSFKRLSDMVKASRKNNQDYTPLIMSDFSEVESQQVLWMGAPVIQNGLLHSYLMFKLPNLHLTKLIFSKAKDSQHISTLFVGKPLISEPLSINKYQAKILGLSDKAISINKVAIEEALAGKTGTISFNDNHGNPILAAYSPITIHSQSWALVANLSEKEAYKRVNYLAKIFFVMLMLAISICFLASYYLGKWISHSLNLLTQRENYITTENQQIEVKTSILEQSMLDSDPIASELNQSQTELLEENQHLQQDNDDQNIYQTNVRELLVETLNMALKYWQSNTQQDKYALAEQSGLWRVYDDRGTLQTRTLDKYLHLETLPKTPRWKTVLSTIDYILENTNNEDSQREKIQSSREQLHQLLAN
ncbi:MAG: hypothetical protein ACK5NC_02865 [Vibrio sp.]